MISFHREMRKKLDKAEEAYRGHVADCATYNDGNGHCAECDRLAGECCGIREEWSEGPEWERDEP